MTVIKNLTFPNSPATSYEEDEGEWDTEVVVGMTGKSFRNSRRTVAQRRFRFTLGGPTFTELSPAYTTVLAVKTAAQGRLYGFKFVSLVDGATVDVAFVSDKLPTKVLPSAGVSDRLVEMTVELEEVIGGTPE